MPDHAEFHVMRPDYLTSGPTCIHMLANLLLAGHNLATNITPLMLREIMKMDPDMPGGVDGADMREIRAGLDFYGIVDSELPGIGAYGPAGSDWVRTVVDHMATSLWSQENYFMIRGLTDWVVLTGCDRQSVQILDPSSRVARRISMHDLGSLLSCQNPIVLQVSRQQPMVRPMSMTRLVRLLSQDDTSFIEDVYERLAGPGGNVPRRPGTDVLDTDANRRENIRLKTYLDHLARSVADCRARNKPVDELGDLSIAIHDHRRLYALTLLHRSTPSRVLSAHEGAVIDRSTAKAIEARVTLEGKHALECQTMLIDPVFGKRFGIDRVLSTLPAHMGFGAVFRMIRKQEFSMTAAARTLARKSFMIDAGPNYWFCYETPERLRRASPSVARIVLRNAAGNEGPDNGSADEGPAPSM